MKDVSWLLPSGAEMGDHDWAGFVRCFGMRLAGDRVDEVDERGRRIEGDTILMPLNAHHEAIPFNLPRTLEGQGWECLVDTAQPSAPVESNPVQPYLLGARRWRCSGPGGWWRRASGWRFRWGRNGTGGSGGCGDG